MKTSINYVADSKGKIEAVVLSLNDYKKLIAKIKKYEQMLNIKADLTQAFKEVKLIKEGKLKGRSAREFLESL